MDLNISYSELIEISSENEEDLQWDDDELMATAGPVVTGQACAPFEHDTFHALLETSRTNARSQFAAQSHNAHVKNAYDRGDVEQRDEYPLSMSWIDDVDKQMESISHTYHDYVNYKRGKASRHRLKAFETAVSEADFGDQSEGEQRRHTFGGESFRDKILTFLDDGDLTNILMEEDLDWGDQSKVPDPNVSTDANVDFLVDDQYYPGLLDDAVNRKTDFNKFAFEVTFGDEEIPESPKEYPMSLLQAFDLRVSREQGAVRKKVAKCVENHAEEKVVSEKAKNFITFLNTESTRKINRDEIALGNVVDIELADSLRDRPENELTRAINCLQRAEVMNEFDKSLQAAEEAYNKAPAGLAESAAVYKARTFKADISKKSTCQSGIKSYNPIEIVSYVGITEPLPEDNMVEPKVKTRS